MKEFLEYLKLILSVLGSPIKTMFVLVFLTGSALFLPATWQHAIGTYDWTHSHLAVEWVVFLFCSLYLFLSGIEFSGRRFLRWRHLRHLASDEQYVLLQFATTDSCTVGFQAGDAGIHTLLKDGVLEQAKDSHEFFKDRGLFYYSLSPKTLRYLKKRLHLLTRQN